MSESKTRCAACGAAAKLMSSGLGICPDCARSGQGLAFTRVAHARSRRPFGLPSEPPRNPGGRSCPLCGAECTIAEGARGFCGLRTTQDGRLRHLAGTPARGILYSYHDPLPTNCVADWVCDGSRRQGKTNLAVFYASCTLDCLFCQNWSFREVDPAQGPGVSAAELADRAEAHTHCVCFFGGDPASQMPHALAAARRLADRGVTVCWETAGTARTELTERALALSLSTGGCVKFDLKAYSEPLHVALSGVSNRRTLQNFARAAQRFRERPDPPLLVASTLLVPGYVDENEVGRIASFVAEQDPDIPYALLAFSPQYRMADLPPTSAEHARLAEQAARASGLRNVRVGNRHLLGRSY